MGGCQNYGSFLGTLNIRCRIILGIQKGTLILTTSHMLRGFRACRSGASGCWGWGFRERWLSWHCAPKCSQEVSCSTGSLKCCKRIRVTVFYYHAIRVAMYYEKERCLRLLFCSADPKPTSTLSRHDWAFNSRPGAYLKDRVTEQTWSYIP